MSKFEVGNIVQVIKKGSSAASYKYFLHTGRVTRVFWGGCNLDIEGPTTGGGFWDSELKLINLKVFIHPERYKNTE